VRRLVAFKKVNMKLSDKKTFKYKSDLFSQEATLTVDENLNKLKGKILAPKKLAAANKSLRKLKDSLPK
jgi:hypothetical protein